MHLIHVTTGRADPPRQLEALRRRGHSVQPWRRPPHGLIGLRTDAVLIIDGEDPHEARRFSDDLTRIHVAAPRLAALDPSQLAAISVEWSVDDFVLTTSGPAEWERRLLVALERRRRTAVGPVQRVGDVTLDAESFTLSAGSSVVPLTRTEHRVLRLLFSNPEVVFPREAILAHAWGAGGYESRNIDTFICRLRRKVGPARDVIETVRGVGYRVVPISLDVPSAAPLAVPA